MKRRNSYEDSRTQISCLPSIPTLQLRPQERAIGRLVRARTVNTPEDQAQVDLVGDIMFSLYKHEPQTRENVPPAREVNKFLVDWALSNPEFESARSATAGNLAAALASAGLVWESLVTDEALKEAFEEQRKAEEARKQEEEELREMSKKLAEGNEAAAEEARKRAEEARKKANEASQAGVGKLQKVKGNPIGAGMMGSLSKQAAQTGKDISDAMGGWGIGAGDVNPTNVSEIMDLLNKSKGKSAEIAKLAGRFKRISQTAIGKARASATGAVTDAAYTRRLLRIFPTERAKIGPLASGYQRARAVVDYANRGLLGLHPKADKKLEGSFIAEVDGSGSMYGGAEELAKAIALGIAWALRDDKVAKRYYELRTFGDRHDHIEAVDSTQNWQAHVEWADHMPGGGTDFDRAFSDAILALDRARQQVLGTDLFFITDGWAYISDRTLAQWRSHKEQFGTRLLYINIGPHGNDQVKALADLYIQVSDSADLDDKADLIVEQITSKIIENESGTD
jgi:uncharacterized protein with von Willebrand factor type A (vWA) domain